MSTAAPSRLTPETSVSYWSVVAGQLRKNKIAMGAARTVAGLFTLAIVAPLLAMNIPVLASDGGGLSAPVLDTLFDRFIYPGGVDVFFNLLFVVGAVWYAVAGGAAWIRRGREKGWLRLVRPLAPLADVLALSAAVGLVVLDLVPEGTGGWVPGALRALCWVVLAPALPWTSPLALLGSGLCVVFAGPAFVGWLLIGLAFPPVTAALLVLYLLLGWITGAGTIGWLLLLVGVPGAGLWLYAARRAGEAVGDVRRGRRLRWARLGSGVLFVVTLFLLLGTFRETKPLVDWTKRSTQLAQADEGFGLMPPIPYHPDNVGETGLAPVERSLKQPDARNTLGCDLNGRDVAARLIFGTRISLTIGLVAVSIYVTIGIILGSLAGFYRGWVDILISRLIEVMICFPVLFLLLTIVAVFESRSIFLIMAGIGLVGWPTVARLVRGEFLRQRNLDYVTAAEAQGLPEWRVIFGHVLPNCVGPVLVSATFGIAAAILTESGLAFLGLGDSTASSWGKMLTDGRSQGQWHMILAPGFAIFFVVTIFNLLGEGLRDALDPKLRR